MELVVFLVSFIGVFILALIYLKPLKTKKIELNPGDRIVINGDTYSLQTYSYSHDNSEKTMVLQSIPSWMLAVEKKAEKNASSNQDHSRER